MRILGSVVALFACLSAASSQSSNQFQNEINHILSAGVSISGALNNSSAFDYKQTKSVQISEGEWLEHFALYWRGIKVQGSDLVIRVDHRGRKLISGSALGENDLRSSLLNHQSISKAYPHDFDDLSAKLVKSYELESAKIRNIKQYISKNKLGNLIPIYKLELIDDKKQRRLITLDAASLKVIEDVNATASFLSPHTESYYAVATTTGNYKVGFNCHQSPNMASEKCQNTILPNEHPLAQLYYPIAPTISNLYFRTDKEGAFSEFAGYPMVVKLDNGQCVYSNHLVETYYGSSATPHSYDCSGGVTESHGINGEPYFYYLAKGAFKAVNDAHFYAGLTAQVLYGHFSELYPEQSERCPEGGSYCLNVIKQRADSAHISQSSWDGEFTNYASGFRGAPFPHGSSIDIVAHEIGHAILEWNTGNIISNVDDIGDSDGTRSQRSALHESFADITAIAVKDHYYRNLLSDPSESNWTNTPVFSKLSSQEEYFWAIGWDARIRNTYSRFLKQPRRDGVSIDDYRDFESVTGSHQRAGAFNKLFYLIATSDEWNVERAYGLVIKAMTACFNETTGMLEAAQCLIEVANDEDKQQIAALAKRVGLIPQDSRATTLEVSIERLFEQVSYHIADERLSGDTVDKLIIRQGEETLLEWVPNTQKTWLEASKGEFTLSKGDHELHWQAELNNGSTLESYRIASLIEQAICKPESSAASHLNSLTVNGEALEVTGGYEHVRLVDAVYSQAPLKIQLPIDISRLQIKAYIDLDRNGYFDTEEIALPTDITNEIVLPKEPFGELKQGPALVRLVVGEQNGTSSCTSEAEAQTIDVKFAYLQGEYIAPALSFGYKQFNDIINLDVPHQYSNAYSFKWLIDDEQFDTDSYTFSKQMSQSAEVSLVLLRDGEEVNRVTQQVTVVNAPNFNVQCAQNGTVCQLNLSYDNELTGAKYRWEVNGETIERSDLSTFEYDFEAYGEYVISVLTLVDDGAVQFTYEETIELHEAPELDINVTQQNMNFTFNIGEALPEGYELVLIIDGVEYQYDALETVIEIAKKPNQISYVVKKGGIVIKQEPLQLEYIDDPQLSIDCLLEGSTCQFTAEHADLGENLTYHWDFGNGETAITETPTVSHSYEYSDSYIAALKLVVNEGAEFTVSTELTIDNPISTLEVSSSQHNRTIKLEVTGETSSDMSFVWFIGSERLSGKVVSFDIAELGGEYNVQLQILKNDGIVKEINKVVVGHPDIGLDFVWKLHRPNTLNFEFSVSK
ncbi:PKD domain-containing protein [Pseudoalteromonas luteoviolacea]|uniref:PKD domain-containing protein n=1 Tax=Pseudoalteromonas luteoviolacea TaxID=43657 RepID=UPI001B37239F|nr:PKD domain-containing protein [Pseudoalteromonas luteoviolacea]